MVVVVLAQIKTNNYVCVVVVVAGPTKKHNCIVLAVVVLVQSKTKNNYAVGLSWLLGQAKIEFCRLGCRCLGQNNEKNEDVFLVVVVVGPNKQT